MDVRPGLLVITGWQFVIGSAPLFVAAAWTERAAPILWQPAFISLLLFLALVATAFSTTAWFWLIRHDEVGRLSLLLFLVPMIGLGLGPVVFGERFTTRDIVATLVIAAGIATTIRESYADVRRA